MVGNVSEVTMSMSNVDIRRDGSLIVRGTDIATSRGGDCMSSPTEMRVARRAPNRDADGLYELTGFRMVSTSLEPFIPCTISPYR